MDFNGNSIFLYMNFFRDDDSIGITKKIKAQIKTLKKMGFDVTYTSYTDDGVGIYNNEDTLVYSKKYALKSNKWHRYRRRFLLLETVKEYLAEDGICFNYAYLRWHTFDRSYLRMLQLLKGTGSVNIVEAHAWTSNRKARSLIGKYQIFMDDYNSWKVGKYVDLVAAMSEEDNIWGIKTIKVDNAVDLETIRPRHWQKTSVEKIRFLSVANEYPYHGYDRFIKGIYNYYKNGGKRDIELKLAGVFMESTRKLVNELNLDKRVIFYGKKSGNELDDLYDSSDMGVGALAHHRISMFAGSSLKTKEYFAKGLPFIYGWREPAFDESYRYALKVDLNEEPIDLSKVISFYDQIENDDTMLEEMRKFAEINYTWEAQFKKIFSSIISRGVE